ncbi:MAG TPA: glycosyltransferase [Oscillatoriales cyanobacterium M59_W2019_021]|nr:glycosyltransferase [Oscillatoriales cyanobacterium M4454_W2019_049]HIK52088.1 glycosyltransferase [Oscillatoriales cyanobacterium M59_W2019_021]
MMHFGIICPAAPGHLNPLTTLGWQLQQRGHRVTLLGVPFGKSRALAAGLGFEEIGRSRFPGEKTAARYAELGKLTGLAALRYNYALIREDIVTILEETPDAARRAGVEALLIDQVSYEGITVAEHLGLPHIEVCTGVMMNREAAIPPYFTPWEYNPALWAQLRNRVAYAIVDRIYQPTFAAINQYRRRWNLPLHPSPEPAYSSLAQLCPHPAEFEFPRTTLPPHFYFAGPYANPSTREPIDFPYEKLTGKPLIYASMGTLQNRRVEIFQAIARACDGLDAQLVISLGGAGNPESLGDLPGSPVVVGNAPQLQLLEKASVAITHAGMNTALEALSYGVPMVAVPVTNDQPGVAARVAWTGSGEVVPASVATVARLRSAISRVLTDDTYRNNARRMQRAIAQTGGLERAAEIIERKIGALAK